ncbi:type I restriction-modification system subunit M [Entomomonas asaccharolytica]|uniref:site-specific DNA-methyltransferase (adenine-specific) n=1 Tax=Entomomonas asaccharolytica TaxID=2785331 RepID=A0A974RWU6_9GAMM|nr:type I restriction-modification system subunit M [Entomomonas asaccharolytica]QQP85535.1 type I restriction-modification system subunit M [Entomomonas asaccharolytica]
MSEEQLRILQQQLWAIANTLRGKMNADEFRNYILGFIFYKYLSEKMQHQADELLAGDNIKYVDIDTTTQQGKEYTQAIHHELADTLGYFLAPNELFHRLAKRCKDDPQAEDQGFILEDLGIILNNIEKSTQNSDSADDFDNLFEDLDLTSTKLGRTVEDKNSLVSKIFIHLDDINFDLTNTDNDVLGDAYEYLIGQFASDAGKKAGEFYTPQAVSTLLAKIVTLDNKTLKNVYDPTCGSGSLLLRVKREAKSVDHIYGQELNRTTYNLARMNMILHDVHYSNFDIRQEDTLEKPQHLDKKFQAIVANPPFSAHWSANPLHMNDNRFGRYGKLAPRTKADMAFVQHMYYQLAEDGTMAVILPHGILFRGAAEGHIRQYLIAQLNCIDAVIGLPANIFFGTSIPTCVLVVKKCRKQADNILFIDASQEFEKAKTQNKLRLQDINKIIEAYKARKDQAKYSYVASLQEIKDNDYNLNIPRYVDTFEEEAPIDINTIAKQLSEVEQQAKQTDLQLAGFCDELGILPPFSVGSSN